MSFQKVIIVGRLGKEPELKYTPTGVAVCTFSMATSKKVKDLEETEWWSVVLWDKLAETAGQYLAKGREVLIEGEMKTRSWDKDGVKQYRTELIGRSMQFVGNKPGGDIEPDAPFEN